MHGKSHKPVRLLHVIASADPAGGGPIEGILQQAKIRRQVRHIDVDVATLDFPTDPYVKSADVNIIPLGAGRTPRTGWRRRLPWVHYGYAPLFVPWLRRNASNYDAIIVNGIWNYSAFGARRALVGGKVPYVVFTHGMLDPWFKKSQPVKAWAKQLMWWFCEGPLLSHAHAVLFTTEDERILARNAFFPYRVKERVVGYGTADLKGDPVAQREAFRGAVPQLGTRPYLLYLSRIHPKKGCDLLIEAFAAIAPAHPELVLVMAGPDQTGWRPALEERARALGVAGRIIWPGMLAGDVKAGAFRGAEAFVLPSHQENFGIVVAESMAAGVPVLITDKVNIWREIESSNAGLVETDNVDGVTSLLKRFFALDPAERAAMGQRARQTFLDKFEIHRAVQTIDAALFETIDGGRA